MSLRITSKRFKRYVRRLRVVLSLGFSFMVMHKLLGHMSTTDNRDSKVKRKISIDLGGGKCKWTDAVPAGKEHDIYGTLFASYPAAGMRVTWQHTEAIS
eukprot:11148494-Ditylum_brightwellii.AAC.1